MWVSDTVTHFKNAILTRLREALRVDHQFAVAYSPWSNGTCGGMVKEVVRSLRSIILEKRRAVSEWVNVLPAVEWALNTAFRPPYGSTPYHVMLVTLLGRLSLCWRIRPPGSGICDALDNDQIKRALKGVLELQEQFHVQVQESVAAEREPGRKESSAG